MKEKALAISRNARRGTALVCIIVTAVIVSAGFLRFYRLSANPNGFFCDEASVGYNAYSILETGRDEHGQFFPLYFRAFGDYKSPVYIYLSTIPVFLFGLTEFATRFWSALMGTLTILYIYLLVKEAFGGRRWLGVICAAVLAFMPWHVHLSRFATDGVNTMVFFIVAGIYYLMAGRNRRPRFLYLGALFMAVAVYNYNVGKIVSPLLFLLFLIINAGVLWSKRRGRAVIAIGVFALCMVPLVHYARVNPVGTGARWKQVSIFSEDHDARGLWQRYWRNYRDHFSASFLFTRGDQGEIRHSPRFGELLPFSRLFIAAGGLYLLVFGVVRRKSDYIYILAWLAIFPAAGSFTKNVFATRAEVGAPAFAILTGVGVYLPFFLIGRLSGFLKKVLGVGGALYLCAIVWFLGSDFIRFYREYFYRYPVYSAPFYGGWQYGNREVVRYLFSKKDQYDLLVITPTDGNQPGIFPLFYTAFDPQIYQREGQRGLQRVEKFVIGLLKDRHIRMACQDQKVLLAVRERELAELENYKEHKRITLPDGKVVFVIISDVQFSVSITDWMILGPFGDLLNKNYLADAMESKPSPGMSEGALFLSDTKASSAKQSFGELSRDRSVGGGPISIRGDAYQRGLGTHANSEIVFSVPEGYSYFEADVGLDDAMGSGPGSVIFVVCLDDREILRSPIMTGFNGPFPISIPLGKAKELKLVVEDAGDGIDCDHADWGAARLSQDRAARDVQGDRGNRSPDFETGSIDIHKRYVGKNGMPVSWRIFHGDTQGYVDFNRAYGLPSHERATAYALNYLTVPSAGRANVTMNLQGAGKLWINDVLEMEARKAEPGESMTPFEKEVNLMGEKNKILLKCLSRADRWRFSLRILDNAGQPIRDSRLAW